MTPETKHNPARLVRVISTTAALLATCPATAQTLQFRATEFDNATAVWPNAADPSVALASTHPKTNGWTHAGKSSGAICFGESGGLQTSPLEFGPAYTGMVKQAFIVLVCDGSPDLSTILSAPCPLRFVAHDPESWFATPDTAAARELNETLLGIHGEVSVNTKPANLLKPGAKPQLVSVTFEDATPLSRVYVGGAAGSPRWKRAWNGSIAEMLFFAGILDENQTASVLKYLSVKHKLGLPPQAADNPTKTLKDLGVSHGGVFATMTLVR